MTIDWTNKHMVAIRGDSVIVLNPQRLMTAGEALAFAAWLVTMAECVAKDDEPPFEQYLAAIRST